MENGNGFEQWLEQELQKQAVKQSGPSPVPTQSKYHAAYLQGGPQMSVLAKAATVVSAKGAVGLTVAALALGGVAAEAAITGSANPGDWGHQVVQQVNKCKDALAPGSHGIGQCVSAFAKQHGPAVSSEHRASGARENHPTGKPSSHPTGAPTSHPGGRPSSTPGSP